MKGYFISFEGPDGSGKSTVLSHLLAKIGPELKPQYLVTREPGGSAIAEQIRKIILDPANQKLTARTEALLYAASRSQHVEEVVKPALAAGKLVFSDRFVDSSLAYQGAGRQLGMKEIKQINDFATAGLTPDLTLFFALDPALGLARIAKERPNNEDRLEQERLAFHRRVYAGYQKLQALNAKRIVEVDAAQSIEQVTTACMQIIKQRFPEIFKK